MRVRQLLPLALAMLAVGCPTPEPTEESDSGTDVLDGAPEDARARDGGGGDGGDGGDPLDSGAGDAARDGSRLCASPSECQNGVFCDGAEACTPGAAGADERGCIAGTPPCAAGSCDETGLRCSAATCDAPFACAVYCGDGRACTGTESCTAAGCVSTGAISCLIAGETCIEGATPRCGDACTTHADCSDGLFCNGVERCADGGCEPGASVCGARACDEASDRCRCTTNAQCDDGLFCNGVEYCPSSTGFCATLAPVACPSGQFCAEGADRCLLSCTSSTQCSDGRACNGVETCTGGRCSAPTACVVDADGDGFASSATGGDDCDDTDALRHPSAIEVCDAANRDEDCDPATFGLRDADSDGAPDAACCNRNDVSGALRCGSDCDDRRPSTHPTATESCNGFDDDCDRAIDETVLSTQYRDRDGDGSGDASCTGAVCAGAAGWSTSALDCDDARDAITNGSAICDPSGAGQFVCTGGAWVPAACPAGTTCRPQPNGTGVCL